MVNRIHSSLISSVRPSSLAGLTPPIQSLTPTLQESLNWSTPGSGDLSFKRTRSIRLSSLKSERKSLSSFKKLSRQPLSLSHVLNTTSSLADSSDDSVFNSSVSINLTGGSSISEVFHTCMKENDESCDDCGCGSHLKIPSRQESEMDDTPQMHR